MIPKENLDNEEQNNTHKESGTTFESLNLDSKLDSFLVDKNISKLEDLTEDHLRLQGKDFLRENEELGKKFNELDDKTKDSKLSELIQKKLEKNFIEKDKLINDLSLVFDKTFDLSAEQKDVFKASANLLNTEKLRNISLFKSLQEKFLIESGIYKKASEIEYKENNTSLLEDVFGVHSEIENNEHKIIITDLIRDFNSINHISRDDLIILFAYLNDEQKTSLYNYFISKISLKTLKDTGFKKETEVEKIKQDIIDKHKENYKNLKLETSDLDENNIFLDNHEEIKFTPELEETLAYITAKEINKLKDETIKENYQNSILSKLSPKGDSDNVNQSFIDYIKQNPLDGVNGIENLKAKNFLVLETKKPDGTSHRIIQKIEAVDLGHSIESKAIKLTNYTSSYGVLKSSDKTDIFFYDDFYNFLQIPQNAKQNEEDVSINFLSEEDYEHYLKGETKKDDGTYEKTGEEIPQVEKEEGVENKADLKAKIDAIDPAGVDKDITIPGSTTFVVGKPGDKDYGHFSILAINEAKGEITLSSKDYKTGVYETLSFSDFLTAFESKEAKRGTFIGARDPFVADFLKMKAFEGKFEFKDGEMIEKVEKGEKARKLEYFANSAGKAIKVEEWGSDYVSICTGELKEKDNKKTFSLSYPQRVTYEDFYNHINDFKSEEESYKPVLDGKERKPDEIKDAKRGYSIGKKLFSFYCTADIVTGLKMLPTLVEDYLKQGSSIRSAKLALALGKNLPDAVRLQLQAKVESEEKKAVEDLVGKWIGLDSTEFIPRIENVIKDGASEDYEVEAAMISILKKYGVLYRGGLAKYKGSFIWYKSLGGKPNDTLYNDIKDRCEKNNTPFTEELLLEELLKIQSLPIPHEKRDKYGIIKKRRSKFGKDFGGYIGAGIKDELADGKAKTEGMLSAKSIIEYSLGEFSKLAHNNGLGAMEEVWKKGGDAHLNNMIPHIITSTGLSQSLWDSTLSMLYGKSFTKPYPALHFCKTKEDIQTYRNVCRKLVDKMGVSKEDKSLFETSINDNVNEADRIKAAKVFYEKHGEDLTKKLMINQDPIIFLEKDKDPDFKKYYDKLHELYNFDASEYTVDKGALGAGFYDYDNASLFMFGGDIGGGPSLDKLGFGINDQTFNVNNDGRMILVQYINGFKGIANINKDEDDMKKVFKYYYKTMETIIHNKYGDRFDKAMQTKSASAIHLKLKAAVGFEMYQNPNAVGNPDYSKSKDYDKFLDEQWANYKARFIDKTLIEEKGKSEFEKTKEEKIKVEDDVFKILKGEKKVSDLNKESPKKEEKESKIELDDEDLEEKEDECNTNIANLKKLKNGSPEQIKLVELISKDLLWETIKKDKNSANLEHPFYGEMKISLVNGKLDYNNFLITLFDGNGLIKKMQGKIDYTNSPKK
ncbi:MAG: hypothetical protein PHG82_04550 [Candidatus Gracilibacteria bacterium]|nr:hypothetical protein [Candidatus Gracilibacteria bacterium]